MNNTLSLEEVVHEIGLALQRGDGAYFIGSGISVPSGLPDWFGLIHRLARPLGIVVTKDDDLPQIAQYCVNADSGNRGPLLGRLRRELSRPPKKSNRYHEAIGRTNISTIWTTNFDTLLEPILTPSRLAIRASDADLTGGIQDFDIELLKVHGCIDRSGSEQLVLTQSDYEEFTVTKPALAERLRHDLIHKTLLFIGYGYRDPNIRTVVAEARRLSNGVTREHFLVTPEESEPDARARQMLWLTDLRRSGIRSATIKEYDELSDALRRLSLLSRGASVYVTGGHEASPELASKLVLCHSLIVG
jgi:hypothetical protein